MLQPRCVIRLLETSSLKGTLMYPVDHESTVYVRTSINATHNWPDAGGARIYLMAEHMHTFHFTAWAKVEGDDRDIEFHDLRDQLDIAVAKCLIQPVTIPPTFGPKSCETIGAHLLIYLPEAVFAVEVQEDEDCGARVVRV